MPSRILPRLTKRCAALTSKNGLRLLTPGQFAIPCSGVTRVKRGPNGEVQSYRVRIVAGGHRQVEGVNYTETFSAAQCSIKGNHIHESSERCIETGPGREGFKVAKGTLWVKTSRKRMVPRNVESLHSQDGFQTFGDRPFSILSSKRIGTPYCCSSD